VTLSRLALVTVRLAITTMVFAFARSIFVESSSERKRKSHLEATREDALAMQKPTPNDAIVMCPPEKKAA
jgi:hypothetical protein